MADMNIAERFMPQDGHIQIHHRGARVDIRVGTMPTIYGESLVMRLLEKNSQAAQRTQELGLDPATRRAIVAAGGKAARPFPHDRPHRQRQNHDALFDPAKHLHAGNEDPDDRRSGGI